MNFIDIYKNLLPRARAWSISILNKPLRQFFEGLDLAFVKTYIDLIWLDIFPDTTRELDKWENQWNLRGGSLTEQGRRDRLTAAWRAIGGQDPRYIQDTLQANGFDVYVHEWWEPGSRNPVGQSGCVEPRNPFLYLREENVPPIYLIECGEALAECGEARAECGETNDPQGYPLVNKIVDSTLPQINLTVLCGESFMECGEESALCGDGVSVVNYKTYVMPPERDKWSYFLYIGGETFPNVASVDAGRQDEFEDLCLKISPTHLWLGMLIDYN